MPTAAKRFYLAVFSLLNVGHAVQSAQTPSEPQVCAHDSSAIVKDTCVSFSTLDALNANLRESIQSLTKETDFFSYYRLNLYHKVCPFWADDEAMCGNIACSVSTIDNEQDIPMIWRSEELGKLEGPKAHHPDRKLQKEQKPLLGELGDNVGESCVVEYDDECDERDYCVPEDERATAKGDYVSLLDNPERFTGYTGPSAHHVWEAIYRENCFTRAPSTSDKIAQAFSPMGLSGPVGQAAQDFKNMLKNQNRQQQQYMGQASIYADDEQLDGECLEKRAFYRVISGMHASISTHLCYDYLNQTTGQWGPNLQCYKQRLHEHPERIANLYFDYAILLRAVAKVRNVLEGYTFCSGDLEQDRLTKQKVIALADQIAGMDQVYDESLMFQDPSTAGLKEDFRIRFRNVSRTMDCVGCDKCRLWGKLQTAGYGTALKILFEFDENGSKENPPLRRTEVVALINTLDKISSSISALKHFRSMVETDDAASKEHPSSNESVGKEFNAEAQEEGTLTEDDGLREELREDPPVSIREEFLREFDLVWRTFKWVLRGWLDIPANILKIGIVEAAKAWEGFLGLPRRHFVESSWKIRSPPKEEL